MIPLDNQAIRSAKIAQCKKLTMEQRKHCSQRIAQTCQSFIQKQDVIALFMPMSYEPDITSLYYDNHKSNCFALPKVTSKTTMDFVLWNETTDLQAGTFGILEPCNSKRIDPEKLTLIFVPLVAFNHRCERLGHGNGYYDRYLKQSNARKIGIAFSFQQSEKLQSFAHDVPLDVIITEKACFYKDDQDKSLQ